MDWASALEFAINSGPIDLTATESSTRSVLIYKRSLLKARFRRTFRFGRVANLLTTFKSESFWKKKIKKKSHFMQKNFHLALNFRWHSVASQCPSPFDQLNPLILLQTKPVSTLCLPFWHQSNLQQLYFAVFEEFHSSSLRQEHVPLSPYRPPIRYVWL